MYMDSEYLMERLMFIGGQFGDHIDLVVFILAAYAHYGYAYDTLNDLLYISHYLFASTVLILSICRAMWYCRITTWPLFIIPLAAALVTIFHAAVRFVRISVLSCVIHMPNIAVVKIASDKSGYVLVNGDEILGTIFSSILDKLTESCDLVDVEDYDDVCAICLDDMKLNHGIYRVRECGHHYHGLCILRSMQSSKHVCVQCRDEAAPSKRYNIPQSIQTVIL